MAHERREKEVFLASEKHASRGFMTQANKQLELLLVMSETEPVARCLSKPPLGRRTAAAVSGVVDCCCCCCCCCFAVVWCNNLISKRIYT